MTMFTIQCPRCGWVSDVDDLLDGEACAVCRLVLKNSRGSSAVEQWTHNPLVGGSIPPLATETSLSGCKPRPCRSREPSSWRRPFFSMPLADRPKSATTILLIVAQGRMASSPREGLVSLFK